MTKHPVLFKCLPVLLFKALLVSAAPQITKVELQADETVNRAKVADLLDLSAGDVFSRSAISKGLGRIAAVGLYKRIEASFEVESGVLQVSIEPLDRIADIEIIIGKDPKYDRKMKEQITSDILGNIPFRAGSNIEVESIPLIREKIESRLKERGFDRANVVVALQEQSKHFEKKVLISLDPGERNFFDGVELIDFKNDDIKLLRRELIEFQGFSDVFPEFKVPDSLVDYPEEYLLKNLRFEKKIEKANRMSSKSRIPMDWVSLNQALSAWAAKSRASGFYEFRQTVEVLRNGESKFLRIQLKRGPRYRIQISGTTFYWERELRSQILDKTLRLGVPLNLQDAQTQIENRYKTAGFAEVVVEYRVVQLKGNLVADFTINEGRRYFLSEIKWDGLTEDEVELVRPLVDRWRTEISPITRIYYSEEAIPFWFDQLATILKENGYLSNRILGHRAIKKKESPAIDLELSAQLGTRYKIRDVIVTGRPLIDSKSIKKALLQRRGDWANLAKILASSERIKEAHEKQGFVSCDVSKNESDVIRFSDVSDEVDLVYTVDPGPGVRVGKILVEGLGDTKEDVVVREFESRDFEQGAVWNPSAERDAEGSLLGLNIFSSVKRDSIGGRLLSRADETGSPVDIIERDLKVTVVERPAGAIEFGPGYRSDLGIAAFAELNYRNLWGMNRSVFAQAQISRKIIESQYLFPQQNYSITYLEPYVFNQPLRFRVITKYTKEDKRSFDDSGPIRGFAQTEFSLKFLLERDFGWIRASQGLYSLTFPKIFEIISAESVTRKYRIASIDTFLSSDTRDNLFNPTKGIYWSGNFEYAGPDLGSGPEVHYYSLASQISSYASPIRHVTFVGWLSIAHIASMGDVNSVPESKRLTVGGRGSIRSLPEKFLSYEQADVSRQETLEAKVEYRQAFLGDLSMAFFFDGGQIWAKGYESSGFRKGMGVGLRYQTPVGPLSLDLAVNLDRKSREDSSRILFSVGNL